LGKKNEKKRSGEWRVVRRKEEGGRLLLFFYYFKLDSLGKYCLLYIKAIKTIGSREKENSTKMVGTY
jgi:hypothetical protein